MLKCFKISWIAWVFTVSTIIKNFAKGKFNRFLIFLQFSNVKFKDWWNIKTEWGRNWMWLDLQRDSRLGLYPGRRQVKMDGVRSRWAPKLIRLKVPNRPRCENLCGRAKQRGVLKIITHGFVTGFVILNGWPYGMVHITNSKYSQWVKHNKSWNKKLFIKKTAQS